MNPFEAWERENPETMKAFFDFITTLEKNCGLDAKTFQLCYIALQVHRGGTGSVLAHTAFAKKAGATKEEVLGAVLITLMTSGINGVVEYLANVAEAYDNAP
jgi:4-carboxymuconolactone decarboxylase